MSVEIVICNPEKGENLRPMDALPSHVPPALAQPWPLSPLLPPEDPFDAVIPRIHAGPEVFYGVDVIGPGMGSWVFRRADDIRAIYLDTDHFTSAGRGTLSHMLGETWSVIPVDTDGAEHAAWRRLLNPLFTPARAARLNDHARRLARELIARFARQGRCEFIGDFARPLPCTVFLVMMGFPLERMPEFLQWEDAIIAGIEPGHRQWALRNIKAFLFDAIADRRARPGDDLLSELLAMRMNGRPASDIELMGMALNLFLGGLDTITSMAGWHFKHLATHPGDQAALRANPAMILTALEELLRAYALVTMQRLCIRQTTIRGVTVMPGDYVTVSTPLAGRDPGAYEGAGEVRLDRAPTHSAFAYGRHRCLGSHIARKELAIMLEEFLAQVPAFRIEPGARVPMHLGAQMGIDALPLVWEV
jgi:cytochrome P450